MSWPALFGLTNLIAVTGWLALLLLPRRPLVHSLVLFGTVGLLCLAYAAMVVALVLCLARFAAAADGAAKSPADVTAKEKDGSSTRPLRMMMS